MILAPRSHAVSVDNPVDGILLTEPVMLTDVALEDFRLKAKPYKVNDRNGMYAHVSPSGAISFRYDDRLHGRRERILYLS